MRCAALIGKKALEIRAASGGTLQCQRQAREGSYCRQHSSMPQVYCRGARTFLLRRAHRFYCSRCGKRFLGIY